MVSEMTEHMPPHSEDNERTVLASCLIDPVALNDCMGILSAADFYELRHRVIFDAMRVLWNAGTCVDAMTVYQVLKASSHLDDVGGISYVTGMTNDLLTSGNAKAYAGIVKNKALARDAIKACIETQQKLIEGNAMTITQRLVAKLTKLTSGVIQKRLMRAPELVDDVAEEFSAQMKPGGLLGVSSGFHELDKRLSGLRGGDLIVVSADTSVGKTSFAGCVAEYVAQHNDGDVLFCSVEMSGKELLKRYVCRAAEISPYDTDGWIRRQGAYAEALASASRLDNLVFDEQSATIDEVCAQARGLALNGRLELMIVDYLQLYMGEQGEGRHREVASISRALKVLSKELGVPIMLLSQVNKDGQARESRAISHDTDVELFLQRDRESSENPQRVTVNIRKHRKGMTGIVNLLFDKSLTRFENPAQGGY